MEENQESVPSQEFVVTSTLSEKNSPQNQIRDYNEFDDDSEQIEKNPTEDPANDSDSIDESFEEIPTTAMKSLSIAPEVQQPDLIELSPRKTEENSRKPRIFKRGKELAKQNESGQLAKMTSEELTLDFVPILNSIETDAKKGTIKLKVNLSADDAINLEISQFYSDIPPEAYISQRFGTYHFKLKVLTLN